MPGEFRTPPTDVPYESPVQSPVEVPLHPQKQVEAWCERLDRLFESFPPDSESYPVVQEIQATLRGWAEGLRDHTLDGLEEAICYAQERLPEKQGRFTCFESPDQLDGGLDRRLADVPTLDAFRGLTLWTLDPRDSGRKQRMGPNDEKRLETCYDQQYQAAQSAFRADVEPITPEMIAATQDETRHAEVCDIVQTTIMANHAPTVQGYIDIWTDFKNRGSLDPSKDAGLDARLAGYLRNHLLRIILDARTASYRTATRKMVMEAWVQTGILPTEAEVHDRVHTAFTRHMVEDFAADLAVQVKRWKAAKDDREARARQAEQDRQAEEARRAAREQALKEAAATATQRIGNNHYSPSVTIGVAELISLASQEYINPAAHMEQIRARVAELLGSAEIGDVTPLQYLTDLGNAGLLGSIIENSQRS